jgi:hypothetical protein
LAVDVSRCPSHEKDIDVKGSDGNRQMKASDQPERRDDQSVMNDQPVAANDGTQPPESREEKRVRLKREREQKKALADERKRAKIAQQAQKKADERNARIKAGEDATAIEEEERVRKLSAEGLEQKRRYSAILLQAQLPLQGVSSKNPEWDDFKEPQLVFLLSPIDHPTSEAHTARKVCSE